MRISDWSSDVCSSDLLDALFLQLWRQVRDHCREVRRVARVRILAARLGKQRHRDLGQIVEHQIIDLARLHELPRTFRRIAPEAGTTADAYHVFHLLLL